MAIKKTTTSAADSTAKKALEKGPFIQALASVVVLLTVGYFLYQPILKHTFLDWDDQLYVTENPLVLAPDSPNTPSIWNTPIALNYHPVTILTLRWDYERSTAAAGSKPIARAFLQTNILLHLLNGGIVFFLFFLLSRGQMMASFFVSLLFLIHPMHVESVAWVSERKDVLYTCFFLLASISYLLYVRRKGGYWLMISFGLFLLSCLSKAMAVSLVPILFLIDWWENRAMNRFAVWLEKTPFMLLGLLVGIVAIDIQSGGNLNGTFSNIEGVKAATGNSSQFGLMERLQYASYGMTKYIAQFFLPLELSPFYPYPEASINRTALPFYFPFTVLIFAVLSALAFWSRRFSKVYLWSFAFYFFTVVLVSQFISVGIVVMADRYSYLPYIGLAFGLCIEINDLFLKLKFPKTTQWIVLGLFALFLGIQTTKQLKVWKNTETLWKKALELYPNNGQILANLGNYYGKNGKINEAATCFEQAIQAKIQNAMVYEGLGNVYGARNEHEKAAEMFSEAIKIDPRKGNFYFNRGTAYAMTKPEKAILDFEKSLELLPATKHAEVYIRLGNSYIQLKAYSNAITAFEKAIALGGKTAPVVYDLGVAKYNLGKQKEGIEDFKTALSLDPGFQLAKNTLTQLGQLK